VLDTSRSVMVASSAETSLPAMSRIRTLLRPRVDAA
jgi:hypothetical protein